MKSKGSGVLEISLARFVLISVSQTSPNAGLISDGHERIRMDPNLQDTPTNYIIHCLSNTAIAKSTIFLLGCVECFLRLPCHSFFKIPQDMASST